MAQPSEDSRKPLVLIVEDDPAILELLEEIIAELGCRVRSATSTEQALGLVGRGPAPTLAIIDWRIPGSGLRLVERLHDKLGLAAPSVVMITAYPEAVRECEAAPGVVQVLHKPFTLEELEIVVRRYSSRRSGEMPALSDQVIQAARIRRVR